MSSLAQELFSGSVDVVGDLHGDFEALQQILNLLGYLPDGSHPKGRRLVFVGDLTDRGPDSIAVVRWVRDLITKDLAQCVLGNHDLNILLNKPKADNGWFFELGDDSIRKEITDFFLELPLILMRDDLRVVHACWQPEMVSMASDATNVIDFFQLHRFNIDIGIAKRSDLKTWQKEMRHQNLNPVKVLTSGLEVRSESPVILKGKASSLERYPWWTDYEDETVCCFGHYGLSRSKSRNESRAICIDFGNSKRWTHAAASDEFCLAAYRFPEHQIQFATGDIVTLDLGEPKTRNRGA